MFAASLLALALVPSAFAAVSITSPVATTSWTAGQQQTITWMDDGKTPTLAQFGTAIVSVYVGSQTQQTKLQEIVNNVDVSTTGSITFTPDPSIGANGAVYFIRIDSVNLKDTTSPQFPAQAFSAKFTLTGMSGTFNSTVQAQIDGASSAAAGSTAAASSAAASGSSAAATSSKAASSGSASRTSTGSATASATGAAENGASGIAASFGLVSGIAAFVGALVF